MYILNSQSKTGKECSADVKDVKEISHIPYSVIELKLSFIKIIFEMFCMILVIQSTIKATRNNSDLPYSPTTFLHSKGKCVVLVKLYFPSTHN